ncbi:MAG: radical SAM protein, partial [Rhodospirillales bacterium]|nr:radical SAM protein [Rhodospirillales bacterium]
MANGFCFVRLVPDRRFKLNQAELIARYDGRVPRYTSYPTAVHFSAGIGAAQYADWLGTVAAATPISLYLHVPFCERLCLYCGCNTSVVRQESPRRAYAELLAKEITMLAERIGHRAEITSVHWGGGTPTTLSDDCLTGLMDLIREKFTLNPNVEIAIEIDPASFDEDRCPALQAMGINRASLGVQDFDPQVQAAIGRPQSFAQTQACATALRRVGISAINLDLIYGLPYQTEESVKQTAQQALALRAG